MQARSPFRFRAFTLIEIMVVVAIMAIVMTTAIPTLYRQLHPESMQKAVSDIMEGCSHARAYAILQGVQVDLVIHGNQISIQPVGNDIGSGVSEDWPSEMPGSESFAKPHAAQGGSQALSFSARLSDRIAVELMEVNFLDQMEFEEARVSFYPNGTSAEFKMLLFRPDTGERRLISLDVVTGLADVESDPNKWR